MIPGEIVCQDYQIIQRIGQGSFGYVYKIKHRTTKQKYALKTDQKSSTKQQLQNEYKVLQQINSEEKKFRQRFTSPNGHICQSLRFIPSPQSSKMLIMPLYGQNLYNLFQLCQRRFDSSTIHLICISILQNIEYLHTLGYIHRDIKLQNFVVGNIYTLLGSDKQIYNNMIKQTVLEDDHIYMIDFGLTKRYKEKVIIQEKQNKYIQQQKHIEYQIGRKIRGTPMYMSINVLLGIEPSRRDDLQSFMYVVVLLIKGRLPWKNFKMDKKQFNQLLKTKLLIKPQQLFADLPKQLLQIFIYIRNLKFQQTPKYDKIYQALQSIFQHKKPGIQKQYNNQYRKYCWQVYQKKEQNDKQLKKIKQQKKEFEISMTDIKKQKDKESVGK